MRNLFKKEQQKSTGQSLLEKDTIAYMKKEQLDAQKKAEKAANKRGRNIVHAFEKQKSAVGTQSSSSNRNNSNRRSKDAATSGVPDSRKNSNLSVINENMQLYQDPATKAVIPQEKRKISNELLKQFKKHLLNVQFFARLKLIMHEIESELQMTRNGGAVSDDYIGVHKNQGESCADATRKLVTHNGDFKQFLRDNRQRLRTVVNNASKFEDGAPTGVTYFTKKKLNGKYECLEKIKKGSKKIHASQERAIVRAFNEFRQIKDSVFYERNLDSNPTIYNAVRKDRRKNKDDDSDVYQP